MYEEATKQQKRATASLFAAEAVMLEVLGDTQTLQEPMKTFSTYVPKVNPCFWSQKFSPLVALNFHFQSKHPQKLKEIVSLTHIYNSYKMYIILTYQQLFIKYVKTEKCAYLGVIIL